MRVKITNWKKLSASVLVVCAVFALLSLQTKAASQSDAIAVRIMPNVNHDSIDTWYAKQGFQGSPQSLIVDGYEAIRDGRTVFVNAANLDQTTKSIYTNIYLISYNQTSETNTLDILGQLVSHWKFNSNIATSGNCSISNLNCQADTDCPSNYICSNSGANYGKCILKTDKVCLIDSDCPVNLFCDSLKARSIRDVKRLGELNQINSAIESFKTANGNYPSLQSGTYILGSSLSVWPSWKETLWTDLGLSQLLVDPINALGYCDGFDAITCWNNKTNAFVNSNLVLPGGSYAFMYTAAKNGVNYFLCSIFETKDLGYDTLDKKISTNSCSINGSYNGSNSNTAPYVVSSYTDGISGKEFNGYIKVKDNEGDLISWKLGISSPEPWINSGWQSGLNLAPVLQDTGDPNQKKIYAPSAGNPGSYDMILTLTDSRGAATSTTITINISAAGKPTIEAEDANYFVDPVNPLKYTFSVAGSTSKPTFSLVPLNPDLSAINSIITKAVSSASITSVGLNKNKIDFSFLIPTSIPVPQDLVVPFNIVATANGVSATLPINFNLKIEKPVLDFNCENMARIGQPYQISGSSCLLGVYQSGNHNLTYKILSGPTGLDLDYSNSSNNVYLKADKIFADNPITSEVKISVTNEYGASTEKSFNLKVNSFCGDGIKQTPNTEGRGGLNNDGVEECDGEDGISRGISISSDKQYGCTSGLSVASPYPILDNNSCVFKPADNGGGYCGDGICQFKIDGSVMENCWNCEQDCGTCAATLESSADAEHVAYFDNNFLYKSTDLNSPMATTTVLVPGKNVFAFWAQDLNDTNYGLAFKVVAGAGSTIFQEFSTKAPLPVGSNLVCNFVSRASSLNTKSADDYNPANGQSSFTNWTTSTYDDSAWSQIFVNADEGVFKGVPYIWPTGDHGPNNVYGAGAAVYCRLTFDYKPYNMDVCTPDCTNRNCGSDGCGGTCGACDSGSFCNPRNYQCQSRCGRSQCGFNSFDGGSCGTCGSGTVCIDGLCPSSDTNIQICADNAHDTYFNGSDYDTSGTKMSTMGGSGNLWQNIEHYNVNLADQNIFAIHAQDWGGIHGVSATLNVKVDQKNVLSLNTDDNFSQWSCNRIPTTGWTTSWSADSSWTQAVSMNNAGNPNGNALASSTDPSAGISQIWLNDPTYPAFNKAFSYTTQPNPDDIYCRYKFNASDIKIPCVPDCTNKCGGFDGCSGYCESACPDGQVCGGDPAKMNECAVKK